MNFIDNPKAALKHYSTIALAFATFLQGAWLARQPVPASFAGLNYWGVNAFELTSPRGERQFVRWQFVPEAGVLGLTDDQLKSMGDEFLAGELGPERRGARGGGRRNRPPDRCGPLLGCAHGNRACSHAGGVPPLLARGHRLRDHGAPVARQRRDVSPAGA